MTEVADHCAPAPDRLRWALRAHREIPTEWVRETWQRTLPERYRPLLDHLGDQVHRSDVLAIARGIETEAQALNAFVAAMVLGHGRNGYGAWRTARS
jgi:hypothetical protein